MRPTAVTSTLVFGPRNVWAFGAAVSGSRAYPFCLALRRLGVDPGQVAW